MDKDKQRAMEEMEKQLELNLINNYSAALKEVKNLLSFYYEKYATGEELTFQEMNKFNRLKALELQFSNVLNTMSSDNEKNVNDSLSEQYTESFYRTGYGLEQEVNADLNFGLINPNLVYEAVQAPIDKLTLSERMEGRRKEITKKVREGITQGLLQGEGYAKMSQRLTGIFEGEARNLTRIARTEGHRVQESASFESQKHVQDQGVQMLKVWVAALDGRTRDAHRKLDGQKVPLDEYFEVNGSKALYPSDFGIAAQDIHCRCTTITEIEGFSPLFERRARGKDGKGEVISYKTYEQWEKGVKTKKPTIEGLSPKQEEDLKKRFVKVQDKKETKGGFFPAQTLKEAEEMAKSIAGVEKAKFTGLEVDILNEFNRELDKTFTEFPELKGFLNTLGTTTSKRAYAYHEIKRENEKLFSRINLSKFLNKDLETIQKNIDSDIKSGFHFKEFTPKHIISHELAHAIENLIEFKQKGFNRQQEFDVKTWNNHAQNIRLGLAAKSITDEAMRSLGFEPVGRDSYNITKELGKYALSHKSELFAQAIADAISSENPQKYSLEVLRITKERLKK
jgi:SPP1 gp7 family putative phage head morphogenesis protein